MRSSGYGSAVSRNKLLRASPAKPRTSRGFFYVWLLALPT